MVAEGSSAVKEEQVEPDAKKRRVGSEAGEGEAPAEPETDFSPDSRPPLSTEVGVDLQQTTLNVVPTLGGRVLMPLSDGGLQYLLAGARANVGMKSGRYMYEVRIMELQDPMQSRGRSSPPQPRQLVRIGFSTQCASLFLGETADSVCFDSEGFYTADKTRKPCAYKFGKDCVLAVVLNLDASSPNANTLSLFKDGVRAGPPQPVPESLRGKTLYPQITFKLAAVQVNWGPIPLAPLPFKCRMLQSMAQDDAEMNSVRAGKDGKFEVLFPVGVPDEGTFDWLDGFLEKHPEYTELSDRKITEWASSSGLWRPKSYPERSSNDRPEMNFGLPLVDEGSIRKILYSLVPTQPRNYVVMEVQGNLLKERRADALRMWQAGHFKKVCKVVVGQPDEDFRKRSNARLLQDKQAKADAAFRQKQMEEKKKRIIAEQQRRVEENRRLQLEEEKRRAEIEAARMKAEAEAAAAAAAAAAEGAAGDADPAAAAAGAVPADGADPPAAEAAAAGGAPLPPAAGGDQPMPDASLAPVKEETEVKMEATSEPVKMEVKEEKKEEVKVEVKEEAPAMEVEEEEQQPPVVELTAEEKSQVFLKKDFDDIMPAVLTQEFMSYSLPDGEEGFDEIQYEWQGAEESKQYMDTWRKRAKIFTKVDDLVPSEYFQVRYHEWMSRVQEWTLMQNNYREMVKRRALEEAERREAAAREAAMHEAMRLQQASAEADMRAAGLLPDSTPAEVPPSEAPSAAAAPAEATPEGDPAATASGDPAATPTGEPTSELKAAAADPAAVDGQPPQDASAAAAEAAASAAAPGAETAASSAEVKEEKHMEALDVEISKVDDILNVVNGEPLFSHFSWEDWMLLSLRCELYLMSHSFRKDIGDPERLGVHESNVGFYYQKYYKKPFQVQFYGVDSTAALLDMVKDTVRIDPEHKILDSQIPEDMSTFDIFVKLTEECRRQRQQLLDAGNEDARLHFVRPELQHGMGKSMPPPYGFKGSGKGYTPRPPQPVHRGPPGAPPPPGQGYYPGQKGGRPGGKSYHDRGQRGGYGGNRAGYGQPDRYASQRGPYSR